MKNTLGKSLLNGSLSLIAVLALAACHSGPLNTLTQENLDKIQNDMSTAQVEAILGAPSQSETDPIPLVGGTKTTLTYTTEKDHVVVILKNDKVQSKEGTFAPAQ